MRKTGEKTNEHKKPLNTDGSDLCKASGLSKEVKRWMTAGKAALSGACAGLAWSFPWSSCKCSGSRCGAMAGSPQAAWKQADAGAKKNLKLQL